MLFLINLSKVHLGPCNRSFIFTGRRVAQKVCIICNTLTSASLWVGGREVCPPIYPAVSKMVRIWPLVVFFSFTMCFVQHIGHSGKYQRMCSVFGSSSSIFYVWSFRRGLRSCQKLDDHFRTIWHVYFVQFSQQSLLLFPSFCPSDCFSLVAFCRLFLVPYLPVWQGIQISWKDRLATVSDVTWSIFPVFCFFCYVTKKLLVRFNNFSTMGFTVLPHFLLFCRGEDNEI